jgi:uncharacterized protein
VESIGDLKPGMMLEGVVTNVAAFGAFVDVGVHQDGLVHVSALADRFVKNPHDVVKAGQIVKVKVVEVDVKRQRIGLSMRIAEARTPRKEASPNMSGTARAPRPVSNSSRDRPGANTKGPEEPQSAMALAFAKVKK